MEETKLKKILITLNEDNYKMLDLGLTQRVSDNEKFLYKIEYTLFGNNDIQDSVWLRIKDSIIKHSRYDEPIRGCSCVECKKSRKGWL